jgi:hypothetical protein
MKLQVFHDKKSNWGRPHNEFCEDNFDLVAEVELPADQFQRVFEVTNHIDRAWWENPEVTCIKESRSTSVGDVVVDEDGKRFRCESSGWSQF